MAIVVNWKDLRVIEDGCGGQIFKVLDSDNSRLGLEVAMCIFQPGETALLHYHKVMEEIYFVLEGSGEVELDGKWYAVGPEDAIAVPINTKHRMRNTSKTNSLRFLSLNAPGWQQEDMIVLPS